jgi:hypothetical protein
MEQITNLAQSLSPYVIIKVVGDPMKTQYISHWAEKSAMPHVWVKRLNDHAPNRPIIVNIWDLPLTRDKSASMIPNDEVDHFIIVYDPHYRSLFKLAHSNKEFISLDTLIKECTGPLTVIIHGKAEELELELELIMSIPRHVNVLFKNPTETTGLVRERSHQIYGFRVAQIDKQISELIFNL